MESKYSLVGVDGNACGIMAYVLKAMIHENFNEEEIDSYLTDAKSSDYNHLIKVSVEMIAKCNSGKDGGRKIMVDWDDDGTGISTEIRIPDSITDDDVTDYLSDTYGFCVNAWYEI